LSGGASVGIVGLGTIGRQEFALWRAGGFDVVGYDISPSSLAATQRQSGDDAASAPRLTADVGPLRTRDVLVLCLPTATFQNQTSVEAFDQFAKVFGAVSSDQIVIIASSVPIGFSRQFAKQISASRIVHAPERFDPGRGLELRSIPRVLGGNVLDARDKAAGLYAALGVVTHLVASLEIAEASKILENTFRLVNIAFASEFAAICERLGVSAGAVIDAAASKPFGFMAHYPGTGAGGTCIPIVPRLLLAAAKAEGVDAPILEASVRSNDELADRIAGRVSEMVGRRLALDLLVVGATYKADYPDSRGSSALRLVVRLSQEHHVSVLDQLIDERDIPTGVTLHRSLPTQKFDAVVIAVAHRGIRDLPFEAVAPLVLDLPRGEVVRSP